MKNFPPEPQGVRFIIFRRADTAQYTLARKSGHVWQVIGTRACYRWDEMMSRAMTGTVYALKPGDKIA